jgi:PEP-CTERM motif
MTFPHARTAGLCLMLVLTTGWAAAADLDEATRGDFSSDGSAPTLLILDYRVGAGASSGYNVVSGTTGRAAATGQVDRDYLYVHVPEGYLWSELRLGQQTTTGGAGGSFIGLSAGPTMAVSPSAISAAGLLGWRHYAAADRGTDILDDMALAGGGASGFTRPLAAGDYTLWIQELAVGSFNYRLNIVLTPVPEPGSFALMLCGLAGLGWRKAMRGRSVASPAG